MKRIKLTQGQYALVDDEDFEELNEVKWFASYSKKTKSFYVNRTINKSKNVPKTKMLLMHRVILKTNTNMIIDHINHNTLDNRKCNLRFVTKSQNGMNQRLKSNNKSGVIGVCFAKHCNKWLASIMVEYKQINLGLFVNKSDAIKSRKEAEEKYFGKYSYENSNQNG